ncbi:hypothetical protein ABPG74_016851 [Tetrahymena malaccensis]
MSLNDFDVIRKLGEGAYSSVFKVRRISNGQDYAMKNIKMGSLSAKEQENAINEVRFLASLSSQEIIGYKEAFYDEKTGLLHIIMEYCAGGDLLNKIRNLKKKNQYLDEKVVWLYIIQMIKGLKCLHDLNILHRDFKCANIMLTRDHKNLKLGDLNVSKVAKKGMLYTQTGTPYYASPEVWRDKPYNSKSDVWSLGCVIYELVSLNPPFKAQDMEGLFKKVQKGQYDPIPSWYSQDLTDFLSLCLQVNPKMRLTTSELLETPYIQRRLNIAQELNVDYNPFNCDVKQELLKTLKVGKNLKQLNNILPEPQYESTASSEMNSFSNEANSKNPISTQISDSQFSNQLNSPLRRNEQRKMSQPPSQKNISPVIPKKSSHYNGVYSQHMIPSSSNIPSINQIQSEMNLDAYEQRHNPHISKASRSRSIENLIQMKHPMSSKGSQQNLQLGNHRYQQSKDTIPTLPPINENKRNLIKSVQDNILTNIKPVNYNKNYDQGSNNSYIQKHYSNKIINPISTQNNVVNGITTSANSVSNTNLQRDNSVLLFAGKKLI